MSIVNQVVRIHDEDLRELVGRDKLKRKEIMGALKDYLETQDLIDPDDGRFFSPDELIKACFSEIGIPTKKTMSRSSLLKLFGGASKEVGMIDY